MITGAIKSQIDQIWNAFWSGGISNPLEVIEDRPGRDGSRVALGRSRGGLYLRRRRRKP